MAQTNAAKKGTKISAKGTGRKAPQGFTDEEKSAMRSRVQEVQGAARRGAATREDDESGVLATIAAMQPHDRALAERLHALIQAGAPELSPKLWYGMPAYAQDGKLVCHFQTAQKFKMRYATLGFSDKAQLDDGAMWPVAFALTKLTAADEARILALVKKAVG